MFAGQRLIGGVLLIAGTCIGAGMLALPVITAFGGFFPSLCLLALCWLFLFLTAYLLLEVNLAIPGEPNMVTMAGKTLGGWGKGICWGTYLLLLYSLLSAYLSGASPFIIQILNVSMGVSLPQSSGPFIMLLLFGLFVYLGTRLVDWVNRILMAGLILTYFLLIAFLPQHIDVRLLTHIDSSAIWIAFPLLFTSFGFHIVIPSLTVYLHHDRKKLLSVIFLGSAIPFLFYVLWEGLILGIVPLPDLISAWKSGDSASLPLAHRMEGVWVSSTIHAFSFFAILTSFLGVSLSLSDFLADGLQLKKSIWGREGSCLLTFIPPLIFTYVYERGFLLALQFAGIFVAVLLCILPAMMAWTLPTYKKKRKRALLLFVMLFSLFVIVLDLMENIGMLNPLISRYV